MIPCVHASETVSCSSSRATIGAPRNIPSASGATVNATSPRSRIEKKRDANASAWSMQPPSNGTIVAPPDAVEARGESAVLERREHRTTRDDEEQRDHGEPDRERDDRAAALPQRQPDHAAAPGPGSVPAVGSLR